MHADHKRQIKSRKGGRHGARRAYVIVVRQHQKILHFELLISVSDLLLPYLSLEVLWMQVNLGPDKTRVRELAEGNWFQSRELLIRIGSGHANFFI